MKNLLIALLMFFIIGTTGFIVRAQTYTLQIPVLMYHRFQNCPAGTDIYTCSDITVEPQQFSDEMKYLHDNGYQTLTLDQVQFLKNYMLPTPTKAVVITFDDAYISQYTIAYPILKQYGFTANLFIPSALLGQTGFMTGSQAQEMQQNGSAFIYAHTVHHVNLTSVDATTATSEVTDSKTALQTLGVHPIAMMAYPSGARNASVISIVQQAGYSQSFVTCKTHCSDQVIGNTAFTNDIIGSTTAQTVTVVSTTGLAINSRIATSDNAESVVVNSIQSSTQFTAIFLNNHATGQSITWTYSVRAPVNAHFADFGGDMFQLERRTVFPKITIDNFVGLITLP